MANAVETSDFLSNAPEQIERLAKAVGTGLLRQKVFDAIYFHKTKIKSATEVAKRAGYDRIPVLKAARHLVRRGAAKTATKNGEVAYEMIDAIHAHKGEILKLARNPKKLKELPTKRRVVVKNVGPAMAFRPKAVELTVDSIDSFERVKKIKSKNNLGDEMSEKRFKEGIQRTINEPAEWHDWGGEMHDVATTRVYYKGKRIRSVFALKGPGTKGSLVPGKMGKNGDQIARMFYGDARLFVVQYVRDIKPTIYDEMKLRARSKSEANQEVIYYAVIDGTDSRRLVEAYPKQFAPPNKAKGKKL
jgi:hypothetical protein